MEQIPQDQIWQRLSALKSALVSEKAKFIGTTESSDTSLDAGADLSEREINEALLANLNQSLQQLEKAIQKYRSGSYGFCEQCGQAITSARLTALPVAAYCIDCQSLVEERV